MTQEHSSDCMSSRRPLNVCMLAYTEYEGDSRVMRYAETLAARGDTVDVVTLRQSEHEADAVLNGVNVFKIQMRTRDERGRRTYLVRLLTFLFRSARFILQRHRNSPYDLIHVHSVPDFLVFAALLPRLAGAKIILDIHDILPEFYASKFSDGRQTLAFKVLLLVERLSAWAADHVIIANDLWRQRLVERSVRPEKCTTILNYPDPTIFRPTKKTRNDDRFIFLYPGSLNWHQGLDIAVRAFAKIHQRAPKADLHIYGYGPEKQPLIDLARELNLDGRVQVRDPLPLRQIAGIMANADVAVVPKRGDNFGNEAFSTKTLEFMSLGVPLIVAGTAIDRHYFSESVVKFFRCGDENDLAAAMLELVSNPDLRQTLRDNALEFAQLYNWEKNKNVYLDIVDTLTAERQPFRVGSPQRV